MAHITVDDSENLEKAIKRFKRLVEKEGIIRPGKVNLVSATGAGDSFSAMILLGMAENIDIETTAKMGMAASSIAMESHAAVNKDINREEILRRIK